MKSPMKGQTPPSCIEKAVKIILKIYRNLLRIKIFPEGIAGDFLEYFPWILPSIPTLS